MNRKTKLLSPEPKADDTIFMELDLRQIEYDRSISSRVILDERTIDRYADAMLRGDLFPAIDVFYCATEQKYWLAEGFLRFAAHCKNDPQKPIRVRVHSGNREDAQWFATRAAEKMPTGFF